MKYNEAMQTIDTEKALTYLGFTFNRNGSYLEFPCPTCGNKSFIRYHGEKKNVSYCKTCKGNNIIALAVKVKGIEFQEAKKLLLEKATYYDKEIEDELNLNYDLQYGVLLKNYGITEELAKKLGIGFPKGRTMLSGKLTFTVHNEKGIKVAYVGVDPDGKMKFHKSFNPELYLLGYHLIDPTKEIWVTNDMFTWMVLMGEGKQALSNFFLPYVSIKQYFLLNQLDRITFNWKGERSNVAFSNILLLKTFYRFV
jgi:predicted RNA-binding Zn-ribbon protein involved in translation (DUF1610 family)